MKATLCTLVLSLAMSFASATCWTDLSDCRRDSRALEDNLAVCQQEKDSSSRAAYCWQCTHEEENRCLDTCAVLSDIKKCTQFADRVQKKCESDDSYNCRDPVYRPLYIQ